MIRDWIAEHGGPYLFAAYIISAVLLARYHFWTCRRRA